MYDTRPAFHAAVLIATLLAVPGCSGRSLDWSGSSPAAPVAPSPAMPAAPPVNLAGRWLLSSPSRGQCHMTFGSAPTAVEGTIAPEGGCPGKFYMSRKWTYDQAGLTMRDHKGQPLAQLTNAGGGYQGQATSGEPIILLR